MHENHNINHQENQVLIDLEKRIAALEAKPNVAFLGKMRERMEKLERQVQLLQSEGDPIGGAPWA